MKKFYTLLMVALVAITASAKVKVTADNIGTEIKDGAVIALANGQIGFGCKAWFAGVNSVTSEEAEAVPAAALMQLEAAATEGEYYIKCLADGKYIGRDTKRSEAGDWVDIVLVDTKEEAITHKFNVVTASNANVYGSQNEVVSLVSSDLIFEVDGKEVNYNGLMFGGNTSLPNKFGSAGNGPWKVWVVYTLSADEVDMLLNPTPIITKVTAETVGNVIKDGAVIAMANGQIGFGGKAWFTGVQTLTSEEPEKAVPEALMVLEAAEAEGEYYIKSYLTGKYVARDTKRSEAGDWVDILLVDTKEEAITHKFNVVTASNANVYGSQNEVVSLVSSDLIFEVDGKEVNYNGLMFGGNTSLPNKFGSAGNGPWKVWVIWAYENAAAIESVLNPAAPTERGEWTKTIEALTADTKPNYTAPVLATSDMGVAVAGTFDQAVSFGKDVAENIATSSYVAKYDSEGKEKWIVAIKGAATVTALAEDKDGNIIVAGSFADVVTLGDFSIEGGKDPLFGSYYTDQVASFVAVLDANGKVKAVKSYVADMNSDIADTEGLNEWVYYFSTPSFTITSLNTVDNKIILSGLVKGELEYADGESVCGGVLDVYGFMLDDLATGVVLSTDNTLAKTEVVAALGTTDELNSLQAQIWGIKATATADNVYIAAIGTGNLAIVTNETNIKSFKFALAEDVDTEYGLIVANVAAADGKIIANSYAKAQDMTGRPIEVDAIAIDDATLYVAGTFKGINPVDNSLTAAGESDLYIAKFGNVNAGRWNKTAVASNYKEGESKSVYEVATCLSVAEGKANVYGYVVNENKPSCGIALSSDFSAAAQVRGIDGVVTSVSDEVAALYNIDGTNGYVQTITTEGLKEVQLPDAIISVNGVNNSKANAIYDLQGRRVNNAARGMYIINNAKVVVK